MSDPLRSTAEAIVWPPLPDTVGSAMLALQWQFSRTERLPQAELRAQQMRQIAILTAQAGKLPFWRDRLAAAGIRPGPPPEDAAWRRLPILTRAEVRANGPALFAAAIPASHGTLRQLATSGSTGQPVIVRSTRLAHFFWQAFLLRDALWHGLDFSGRMATIGRELPEAARQPDGMALPDWGAPISPLFASGRAAALDDRLPMAAQIAWLRRLAPTYLHTRPANLADLSQYCLEHGVRLPGLRALRSYADTVTPALREQCRAAWGVEILSTYSAEEVGYLGLQCPQQPHYHVQAEGILLEVLRDDGTACGSGETGQVVVTPLHNLAMPLLRYALGDFAEVGGPCACGRSLPVLTRIAGRSRGRLLLPNGTRRFPYNPSPAFATIPAIRRYQIAQVGGDLVEVRYIAAEPLNAAQEAVLIDALADSLGHRFGVRFARVAALPASPSGKFDDVVCELPD